MNELKDYILVLEDVIPHKLCNDILNEYENSNEWLDTTVGGKRDINKKIRNCTTIGISSNEVIKKNNNVRKILDDKVFECTKKAIKKYNEKFIKASISKDSGYELLKYEKGGFYTQHVDSFTEIPRTISCSFTLNDNFKGGEFSFFNNTLVCSLKKGSAIMFPSNFLYPHSVLPVINGTRYSIVTWFI
jgi:predicted 2-oxoglutarate/Fe(II)-dependent dioxygenase YbiX